MTLKMFSIRDLKAGAFMAPYCKPSLGEGEREFMTLVRDERSSLNKYPEDFQLFYIGDYNDSDAKVVLLNTPQHMIDAKQCVRNSVSDVI